MRLFLIIFLIIFYFLCSLGIKPYKCDYCERTFSKSNKRTIHMRSHTGERPYRCAYCDKGFADSDKLNIHIRTHTGERPYACEYCQRSFTRSDKRNQHTRNVHKKELASKFIYHRTDGLQLLQTVGSELSYMNDGFEVNLHPSPAEASASIAKQTSLDDPNHLECQADSRCHLASVEIPQTSKPNPQAPLPMSQKTASSLQTKYKMESPLSSQTLSSSSSSNASAEVSKESAKQMVEK